MKAKIHGKSVQKHHKKKIKVTTTMESPSNETERDEELEEEN